MLQTVGGSLTVSDTPIQSTLAARNILHATDSPVTFTNVPISDAVVEEELMVTSGSTFGMTGSDITNPTSLGLLRMAETDVTLSGSAISTATLSGDAFQTREGTLSITTCPISDMTAKRILLADRTPVTFATTDFTDATISNEMFSTEGAILTFTDCPFTTNTARAGMVTYNTDLTVTRGSFSFMTTTDELIKSEKGSVNLNDCDFTHTVASRAVSVNDSPFTMDSAEFSYTSTSEAAVQIQKTTATISDSTFLNGEGESVIDLQEGAVASITNPTINYNFNRLSPVAVKDFSTATINDASATENGAFRGGFAYLNKGDLKMSRLDLWNNYAVEGGAFYSEMNSTLSLYNSDIQNNKALRHPIGVFRDSTLYGKWSKFDRVRMRDNELDYPSNYTFYDKFYFLANKTEIGQPNSFPFLVRNSVFAIYSSDDISFHHGFFEVDQNAELLLFSVTAYRFYGDSNQTQIFKVDTSKVRLYDFTFNRPFEEVHLMQAYNSNITFDSCVVDFNYGQLLLGENNNVTLESSEFKIRYPTVGEYQVSLTDSNMTIHQHSYFEKISFELRRMIGVYMREFTFEQAFKEILFEEAPVQMHSGLFIGVVEVNFLDSTLTLVDTRFEKSGLSLVSTPSSLHYMRYLSGTGMSITDSNSTVANSYFASNTATRGGALSYLSSSPYYKLYLAANQYIDNYADVGGAIYYNYSRPEFSSNSTYSNNNASIYGPDIGSYAVKIEMSPEVESGRLLYELKDAADTPLVLYVKDQENQVVKSDNST